MRSTTRLSGLLPLALVAAGSAAADDFSFEVAASYDRTRLDARQTIATNAGTVITRNELDTDDYGLLGSWYFTGLSDAKGPRARAAFVDRASVLRAGYARTDVLLSAVVDSTDPLISSFAGSFETDADALTLDLRYVWQQSGWFADAGVASIDTSVSGTFGGSSDSTAWRLGVGKYLFDTTTLALDVSAADEDGGDATNVSVTFSHLGDMGSSWQYAVDLGYAQLDSDANLDFDTWSAALSLFPTRDLEFGVRIARQDSEIPALDTTSYEGYASWFVTRRVVLAARYRVDDVEPLGSTAVPAADSGGDADQDSVGVSVSVRF